MRKLLMLGSSYGTVEMVNYAKSIGVHTIVTDYKNPEKSPGKLVSDEYWMISTADVDQLENKCIEEGVDAVFAPVSEFNIDKALELCNRLQLPFYCSETSWHYSRNKRAFKDACIMAGAPVAKDYYLTDNLTQEELSTIAYPVVVKPNDLCGTAGMSYCANQGELVEAYRYARSLSKDSTIIVERKLEGREFYAYYVLAEGEIRLINVIEELVPTGEPKYLYAVDTCVTDCVERIADEISPHIEHVLTDIGCREGVAWTELMLDQDDHFYILELGYRLSGDVVERIYPEVLGFDSYKWMIDLALGAHHAASELPPRQRHMPVSCGCAYILRTGKAGVIAELNGIEEAKRIPGVEYTETFRIGDFVAYHGAVGIFTIQADDCAELCNRMRKINELVSAKDEGGDDLILKYTDYDYLVCTYQKGLALREGD